MRAAGRVPLRVTNKHAGRAARRHAQATTRSKTTQHIIHDNADPEIHAPAADPSTYHIQAGYKPLPKVFLK